MIKAKVFQNGRSQAIRLPKEFRVAANEVYLEKTEHGFLVSERDPWESFEEACQAISDETLKRQKQPRIEKRQRIA